MLPSPLPCPDRLSPAPGTRPGRETPGPSLPPAGSAAAGGGRTRGAFVLSLDLELYWGVRHRLRLAEYGDHVLGGRRAVPAILELFRQNGIHATWAAVGLLFCGTREELLAACPEVKPQYSDQRLCPYRHLVHTGDSEATDPFHYGASLIEAIMSSPGQEVGTHTFSHYFCLAEGQTIEAFRADLRAAVRVARKHDLDIKSLVFPANQCNEKYLTVCQEMGIQAYRGNEPSWPYRPRRGGAETTLRRAVRFLDAYLNLSGHNTYAWEDVGSVPPVNVRASRFLRPFNPALSALEGVRVRRILSDLTYAATRGRLYHLWWHPHNFGANTERNLGILRRIIAHYVHLRERYGMESLTMSEVAERVTRATAGSQASGRRGPSPTIA